MNLKVSGEKTEPSMEEAFIKSIKDFVLNNLACEDFSLQRLSHEIGYSRSQIHRKLKKITGKSLSQFIREIRLEEASKLLQGRVGTVSEISFKVGFNSPVYFSKCFNDYFGKTPGEILNGNSNINLNPQTRKEGIKKITIISSAVILVSALAIIIIFSRDSINRSLSGLFANERGPENIGYNKTSGGTDINKILICLFTELPDDVSGSKWLKHGICEAIWLDLSQFNYMLSYKSGAESKQEMINAAKRINCPYYLRGAFKIVNGEFIIDTELHLTKNGNIVQSKNFKGFDFFKIIDDISLQARIDIEVSENQLNSSPDLPFSEISTHSIEAFKYYIIDYNSGYYKKGNFVNFVEALKLDPDFALVAWQYAYFSHKFNHKFSTRTARKYIELARKKSGDLPKLWEHEIRALEWFILGESIKESRSMESAIELQPENIILLENLMRIYKKNLQFDKAIEINKKLLELVPDNFQFHFSLANSYLLNKQPDKGIRHIDKTMKTYPEHPGGANTAKGLFLLYKGEYEPAEKEFAKALIRTPNAKFWEQMLSHVDYVKKTPNYKDELTKFTGNYRCEENESEYNYFFHNGQLMLNDNNRNITPNFITSDTSLAVNDGFFTAHFYLNSEGRITKFIERAYSMYAPIILWKEDSLIINAEKLLDVKKYEDALIAYKKAYKENPEHYYLANYIKHLEFIENNDFSDSANLADQYIGSYIEEENFAIKTYKGKSIETQNRFISEIFKDGNDYIWRMQNGMEYVILPMSENHFMNPSIYRQVIKFERNNGIVTGMRIILHSGQEYYFERLNKVSDQV